MCGVVVLGVRPAWPGCSTAACTTDVDCRESPDDPLTTNRCVGPEGAKRCTCTEDWFVVGQGGANGDCMMEWILAWPPDALVSEHEKLRYSTYKPKKKQVSARQTCVDGSSCDLDGEVNGRCEFELRTCFCVADPTIPECGKYEEALLTKKATVRRYCRYIDPSDPDPTEVPIPNQNKSFDGRKPARFEFAPPARPATTSASSSTWKAREYTCEQYYTQRLKERLVGRSDVGEPGIAVHAPSGGMVNGNTSEAADEAFRTDFSTASPGITLLIPTDPNPNDGKKFPQVVQPAGVVAGWPCTQPQRIVVPLQRQCRYKKRRERQLDGSMPMKESWTATYKTGTFSPKGYFDHRDGQQEVDRSGDPLSLECVPADFTPWNAPRTWSRFEGQSIPEDNHCVFRSAGCCAQPWTQPTPAPNRNCCKVSPTTRECCLPPEDPSAPPPAPNVPPAQIPGNTGNVSCE